MHDLLRTRYKVSATDTPNIDSAGATSEFVFGGPVMVTKFGVIVKTAVDPDNSVALTMALSRRPTNGTASGAVALGTFRMMTANQANYAAGTVKFKRLHIDDADGETGEDGTLRNEAPNSNITAPETGMEAWIILPGQAFCATLETNAEADSGDVYSFVEFIELPWNGPFVDQTNVIEDVTDVA